jgi:hypothetical protein
MDFEIIGEVKNCETIAIGNSIKELPRLKKLFGDGRWKKRKGITKIKLPDNTIHNAEIHWYEAHGIGKKQYKIKFLLD